MFFQRRNSRKENQKSTKPRFVPAVERLESRDTPSTLVTSGPFTNTGSLLTNPAGYTAVGGSVYFSATDASRGNELVKQTGSAIAVFDIKSGTSGSTPVQLTNAGENLYFLANTGLGNQLFTMVNNVPTVVPGSPSNVNTIAPIGRDVFLITNSGDGLYRTLIDTTNNSVSVVKVESSSITPDSVITLDNLTGLVSGNNSLWITRTTGSTATLFNIAMGADDQATAQFMAKQVTVPAGTNSITDFTFAGPKVFFNATVSGLKKPQFYNGTSTTALIAGSAYAVGPFQEINGRVYFAATQSGLTRLWSSNGSTATQVSSTNFTNYPLDSAVGLTNSAVVGDTLYYSATTPQGVEPVATTFTLNGTVNNGGQRYFNLATGSVGTSPATMVERNSNPTGFTVANQRVFFSASIPTGVTTFRTDLWSSDGTDAGTFLVNPPTGTATTSSPTSITGIGNSVFYGGNAGKGQQPFQAQMTNTFSAGQVSSSILPTQGSLVGFNNKSYFISGTSLYQSNGTPGGTSLLVNGLLQGSKLQEYGGQLYFFKNSALWKTNGTAATTSAQPGSPNIPNASFLGEFAERLWFFNGTNLYSFNGANSSFSLIANNFLSIAPGTTNNGPTIAELNGTVFFAGADGVYSLAPMSATPSRIFDSTAPHSLQSTANGVLFIDGKTSVVLTNGTTNNVYTPSTGFSIVGATALNPLNGNQITLVEQNSANMVNQTKMWSGLPGTIPVAISGFTPNAESVGLQFSNGYGSSNQGLYLTLNDTTKGAEPWVVNPAGKAAIVANMNPVTGTGSSPEQYTAGAGSIVYFAADDGTNGLEVYRYDPALTDSKTGNPLPPALTANVNPTGSSSPDSLTPSGNSLFWRAQATVGSSRLYAELADPLIPPIRAINRLQPATEVISTAAGTTQVTFQILFNYSVDPASVTKEDFVLTKASTLKVGTIDTVLQVAGTNQYNVTVSLAGTNPGFGELRLDEASNAVFLNGGIPVDRFGGFTAGEVYSINPQNPLVTSLNRFNPTTATPINASAVSYLVTFSTGVDPLSVNPDDFELIQGSGSTLTGANIVSVTQYQGSFSQYLVNVSVTGGKGTLQANVKNGASIVSLENQPYQQPGFAGQVYSIDLEKPYLSQITRLNPTEENTNAAQVTFRVVFSEAMVQNTISPANTFLAIVDQNGAQTYASVQAATFVNSTTYDVRVAGLPLSGTLSLAINPNNQAKDIAGNTATANGPSPVPNQTYILARQGPVLTGMDVINPVPANPATTTVTYRVNFSKLLDPASVSPADFAVGAASGSVSGVIASTTVGDDLTDPNNPFSYVDVVINQLGGNGELILNIPASATILDLSGNAFSGPYTGTVKYLISDTVQPYFETFTKIAPIGSVALDGVAVIRLSFSEGVRGVAKAYLPTTTSGSLAYTGMAVAPANSSGSEWDVTYTGITGSGALTVKLVNSANIQDSAGNPLRGTPGTVVGSFTTALTRESLTPVAFSLSTPGSTPIVEIRDPSGTTRNLQPFDPAFRGGVRCATGDYNGDGVEDVIVTAAMGGNGHVVVYDGVTFNVLASFYSFPGYQGAVNISAGDIQGDGKADVVVGVAGYGASHVKAFGTDVVTPVVSFIAYPGYYGGVTVGCGDVTGDGKAEIVTGTMGGTTPHVVVFAVNSGIASSIYSFYAFDQTYAGSVNVAVADLNGDAKSEIICGSGPRSASTVVVFKMLPDGRPEVVRSFFPFGGVYLGGVAVGSGDWDNNGQTDVVVGAQSGPMPTVQVYNGATWGLIDELFAFGGTLQGGVSIG